MAEDLPKSLLVVYHSMTGGTRQMAQALCDGAVRAGLPRDEAYRLAAATMKGAATMALEPDSHPARLKDMVTSPGGTTIEGIAALEAGGFRSAVIEAVTAAWVRARSLSGGD